MEWDVFQRDVLDVLRQYEGFFDYFERVGSLGDDSRPDCFGRVSRKQKKEVWVVDAKNKPEIDEEDLQRMEKYLDMLESNPIDAGLEVSEISDYDFRGIFVTSQASQSSKFETVEFSCLHQFLQKELVYTDTDKVVREVSKMMERQQLSQSQARVLFRSLKPYLDRYKQGLKILKNLEDEYVGLKVEEPPFETIERNLPVDVVLTHSERDSVFLFDIPYSWEAVKRVDEKTEEIKTLLENQDEIYYAALNTFEETGSDYTVRPEKVRKRVREQAGILSPYRVAELFTPKIRTSESYHDGRIKVESSSVNFELLVRSSNDIQHRVEARLPQKALSSVRDAMDNSRVAFGEATEESFRMEINVLPGLELEVPEKLSMKDFRHKINGIYSSSVNPVLGNRVPGEV